MKRQQEQEKERKKKKKSLPHTYKKHKRRYINTKTQKIPEQNETIRKTKTHKNQLIDFQHTIRRIEKSNRTSNRNPLKKVIKIQIFEHFCMKWDER